MLEKNKPTDPLTALDGAKILTEIQHGNNLIQQFSNRMAIIQGQQLEILKLLAHIDASSSETRTTRVEGELKELELERQSLEGRLKMMDEKLAIKKDTQVATINTDEKIRKMTGEMMKSMEEQKKGEYEQKVQDLKFSMLKAVLISLSVGGVGSIVAFLWWLFEFYLKNK